MSESKASDSRRTNDSGRVEEPSEKGKATRQPTHTTESSEPYNPFENRNIKRPTSDTGALAHMLKTSLGSGILAMPMGFKNAGLIFGFFGTILLGIICAHCVQMLKAPEYGKTSFSSELDKSSLANSRTGQSIPRRLTGQFPDLAGCLFSLWYFGALAVTYIQIFKILVTVQLLTSFILGSTVYVVFMAQTMFQVVEFFTGKLLPVRYYILMLWIPLILLCMVRDLKMLVPFSVVANFFVIVSFSIVLYYIFREMKSPKSVYYIAPFERLPLFLTTVLFAIEGIGTVLTIENEMKTPEHFISGRCPIVYLGMSIVVTVYTIVGFFGYLEYGEETMGSVTLNLPIDDPLAETVKILIAVAILFTYPLQFYVPINLIYDMIKPHLKPKYHLFCNIMVRVSLVSFTIIVALVIPNLEPIITLVGAVAFANLGLLYPSLIDIMIRYPSWGRLKWRLVKDIIILSIAIIALTAGTYTSLLIIIAAYT